MRLFSRLRCISLIVRIQRESMGESATTWEQLISTTHVCVLHCCRVDTPIQATHRSGTFPLGEALSQNTRHYPANKVLKCPSLSLAQRLLCCRRACVSLSRHPDIQLISLVQWHFLKLSRSGHALRNCCNSRCNRPVCAQLC